MLVLLLGGCLTGEPLPPSRVGEGPLQLNLAPITDIPIPVGVTYDAERSLILSERDRWTGRLVMSSSLSPVESFAFYKDQMPGFDWTPVMSVQSRASVLTFLRGDRAATVHIQRSTFGGSNIEITIAPRQEDVGFGAGTLGPSPLAPVTAQPSGGMYPAGNAGYR